MQRRQLAKPPATASFAPFTGRRWRQPDEGQRDAHRLLRAPRSRAGEAWPGEPLPPRYGSA
ncbi:hypothetical protein FJ548_12820 [Mesorhizobium sp. B2-4-17]|nr:hypothetical protein FJ548_12820 [Mesorhizobium sp. B2-4-17]